MTAKKKRKYYRKCGQCGSRHEQSNMVRSKDHSPNGWLCKECALFEKLMEQDTLYFDGSRLYD